MKCINNLMHWAACRMYPSPGGSAERAQGTTNFRASAVKKHERSGPHRVALAMWVSGGEISSALGTPLPHVRTGVLPAFRAEYQSEKRAGSLWDFDGDLSMIELSCGDVFLVYRSRFSGRVILRAMVVPFRNAQGTIQNCRVKTLMSRPPLGLNRMHPEL